MIGQLIVISLRGSPAARVDEVEGSYLGDLMDYKTDQLMALALPPGTSVLPGGGPRLTDSAGNPWTAAWVDTLGQPVAVHRGDHVAGGDADLRGGSAAADRHDACPAR